MRTCPYCAEEIQDAAIVCKHCGRDLTSGRVATPVGKSLQSDITWGILKAVGVLAVAGLVVGMCVEFVSHPPSSGLTSARGVPVAVLVTNETPEHFTLHWSTKGGALNGVVEIPPQVSNFCARFTAEADIGKPYRASFDVRGPGHESGFSSGWFAVTGTGVWVDTISPGHPQRVRAVNDYNVVAAHPCL